jgi:hypothetical protein
MTSQLEREREGRRDGGRGRGREREPLRTCERPRVWGRSLKRIRWSSPWEFTGEVTEKTSAMFFSHSHPVLLELQSAYEPLKLVFLLSSCAERVPRRIAVQIAHASRTAILGGVFFKLMCTVGLKGYRSSISLFIHI